MADINHLKQIEISEIYNFLEFLEDYGHIFYKDKDNLELLDKSFSKISEGIEIVKNLINDSYGR